MKAAIFLASTSGRRTGQALEEFGREPISSKRSNDKIHILQVCTRIAVSRGKRRNSANYRGFFGESRRRDGRTDRLSDGFAIYIYFAAFETSCPANVSPVDFLTALFDFGRQDRESSRIPNFIISSTYVEIWLDRVFCFNNFPN